MAKTSRLPEVTLTAAELNDRKSSGISWAEAGISDPAEFKKFLKRLQYWVAKEDKESVSTALVVPISYPRSIILDKPQFLAHYDSIFTPDVKQALMDLDFSNINRVGRAVSIGNGKLWLKEMEGDFKIVGVKKSIREKR